MNPHDVNYLDQRNKILGLTPQQLINPKLRQMRNNFLSWLFKDIELDVMKVKHFEVTSKNTLTTPKIVLTDSATDPLNDGEIMRNGTAIKGKTGGEVVEFGRDISLDEKANNSGTMGTANPSAAGQGWASTTYTTRAQITLNIDKANELVFLAGFSCTHNGNSAISLLAKILNNASAQLAENSMAMTTDKINSILVEATETNPPIGNNTYTLQVRTTDVNYVQGRGILYGVAVKLV